MTDIDGTTGEGWRVIGPGGGGTFQAPAINPHDPAHVFVSGDMVGAHVTRDAGETWRLFDLRSTIRHFEFDPYDPDTVYAANIALYRSRDRGARWSLLLPQPDDVTEELMTGDHASCWLVTRSGLPGGYVAKILADPRAVGRLWIGVWDGERSTVLVSSDAGSSWHTAAELAGRPLAIMPDRAAGSPDRVTVVTDCAAVAVAIDGAPTPLQLPSSRIAAAGGDDGSRSVLYGWTSVSQEPAALWRSDDGGRHWTRADHALRDALAPADGQIVFRSLAVCPRSPDTLYTSCAVLAEKRRRSGILTSSDGGRSWAWTLEMLDGEVVAGTCERDWMNRGPGWAWTPHCLAVSGSDPDVAYATDTGRVSRSTDGGRTWTHMTSREHPDGSVSSRGLDITASFGVHFDPSDAQHLFVTCTDVGLFHSSNGGGSWRHSVDGVPRGWRNTCYWLEFDPTVRGRVFSVWSNVHDLPRRKMFGSGNLVNGTQQGGVAVSHDGGLTWQAPASPIPDQRMRPEAVPTHIALGPNSPGDSRTLYVCDFGHGVWKSHDSGRTWLLRRTGIDPRNRHAWRITCLPDGTLILLVARGGAEGEEPIPGALYVSNDAAKSWRAMPLPEQVTAPNDLIYDPSDPRRMYLSCWPLTVDGRETGGGLLRTEDGGRSWHQVYPDTMHVYAAAIDPDRPSTVYINTFRGAAFRSDDRGESWRRLDGYGFRWGHRPAVSPHDGSRLFLTTFGGSVFVGPGRP